MEMPEIFTMRNGEAVANVVPFSARNVSDAGSDSVSESEESSSREVLAEDAKTKTHSSASATNSRTSRDFFKIL